MREMPPLKLGLIGDNIAASSAPRLHQLAGRLAGRRVTYDLLVPAAFGMDFDSLFDHARAEGYRGLNITYPYKETVVARVKVPEVEVRALGAVNTVLFGDGEPEGHNTDHSGFVTACTRGLSGAAPGTVCLVGAGGVGKAVAFGLLSLGTRDFRIVERDMSRAEALATSLRAAEPGVGITLPESAEAAADGAEGLVNCTPVGMVGHDGSPLAAPAMQGARWAFDAVYTPVETRFLQDARQAGLQVISGYELFIHQGLHAWELFSGEATDEARIRSGLGDPPD